MSDFWAINLIRFLDFYLIFFFLVGTARRVRQYQNIGKLVLSGPGRWPHLLQLVGEHRTLFMTWATVAPALLALGLTVVQLIASRGVWPEAGHTEDGLTIARLVEHWAALIVVLALGLAMFAVDLYSVVWVADIPRAEMEKYFDKAEYWLRSRTAHVVRVATLGFIHPRKMVAEEVRKALIDAGNLLNSTLWWVNMQMGLRFGFGLSLWLTWALTRP